jgi:flagellar motor switch protein FliN/FliY
VSQKDITPREALTRLGASTAEAIAQVLESFTPGAVERGEVSVLAEGTTPFANVPRGAVASSVSYIDGVTGANIFVLTPTGARNLAGAMGVAAEADGEGDAELSEFELSAIAEAANQMMAAAAAAIGVVLGQQIGISPPDTRVLDDPAKADELYGTAPYATSTTFLIGGESCRLIQLVPSAFVVRMARAMDELSAEQRATANDAAPNGNGEVAATDGQVNGGSVSLQDALGDTTLRVWAELGRARMPLGKALSMPLGAVVDLDRGADAPVDLFVNGLRFAQGHLVLTDDGEWAVCVDEVSGPLLAPGSRRGLPRRPLANELEEQQVLDVADVEAEAIEVEDQALVQDAAVDELAAEEPAAEEPAAEEPAAEEPAVEEEAAVEEAEPETGIDVEEVPEPVQADVQDAEQDVEAVEEAPVATEATESTDPESESEGAGT